MKHHAVIGFYLLFVTTSAKPPSISKQYRTDYEYNSISDAFYKFHTESKIQGRATNVCKAEGAVLVVPSTQEELTQIHGMMKQFPDIGNEVWAGDDGQKHEEDEETPIYQLEAKSEEEGSRNERCEVVTRSGDIKSSSCIRLLPFVCKVNARDAVYDDRCEVYSSKYNYYASVGSCYMVSKTGATWNEAFAECRAEGAHLVVLNSETERQVVRDMLTAAPKITDARAWFFVFAGIRADIRTDGKPRVFRTVLNNTLDQTGFNEWADGEPNNHLNTEYCGSIFLNDGKYNDLNCNDRFGYVCEKEIHS